VGTCPTCGAEVEPDASFCDTCGTDLTAHSPVGGTAPAARETRKVVTIVFADLAGSTSLHERIDAETARLVMERYYAALQTVIDTYDGTLVKLLGDGVMAAFGIPNVSEDDALRAVRAAVAMQEAFAALADELATVAPEITLRVGVNSGEVVVRDDDRDVVGDPVNVAARLQQAAADGEVIVSDATRRLVGSLVTLDPIGELALKGRAEKVRAYRVSSLDRPVAARNTTFVGRDDEISRLLAQFDAAVDTRRAGMAVVLGSAGLGKSRLLDEVVRRTEDRAAMLALRCEPGGATFAPVADAIRTFAGLDDSAPPETVRAAIAGLVPAESDDRDRVVDGITALLLGGAGSVEETFLAVRRLLAAIGADRPVVLVLDDLHWAEPLLLDLTEHLVEWSSGIALLVLVAARPELRELRSSLATPGRLVADVVTLEGLDASASARLAADVVGADELPAGLAGHVLATSEGNPLFLGELVRMLVDDGAVRREGDRWVEAVDLGDVELPPTINALLAARIERLSPAQQTVLERAAIVGRYFSRGAVHALLYDDLASELDAHLEALRRAELVEPDPSWFLGEPVLRFHHVLIREASYQRVLKQTRAELHARFAEWVSTRVGDRGEHDETLGLHYEQAHEYRRELGGADRETRELGARAAAHLAAAGRRALARDDVAAAAALLGRAITRTEIDDPQRGDLALDWCEALLSAGDVERAAAAVAEIDRVVGDSLRLRAWHTCFTGQLAVLTDPQSLRATASAVAAATDELAALGDDAGEAKASFVFALALTRLGQIGACEHALDRALVAARRVGDWRLANAVLAGAPVAALWGPSPVTRASGRCLDVVRVLRITEGSPAVEAVALRCQAVLEALRGRSDAARKMLAAAKRTVEELGLTHRVLEVEMFTGFVELLCVDPVAAEAPLQRAYDGLRERGLGSDAAQAASLLARSLLLQGRADEAEHLGRESEALAGDDLTAGIMSRGVRAQALALRGDHAAAIALATEAVDTAAGTDALLVRGDAHTALAAALRASGRDAEADAALGAAVDLWEAKGATALADLARAGLGSASPGDATSSATGAAPRRVRDNVASRVLEQFGDALVAGRFDEVAAMYDERFELVSHHPGAPVLDRDDAVEGYRVLFAGADRVLAHELLATLGDGLALYRIVHTVSAIEDGTLGDWGETDLATIHLAHVSPTGLVTRAEDFPIEELTAAVIRMYEMHADTLPAGEARDRATAVARSIALRFGTPDPDTPEQVLAPDVRARDNRSIGFGTGGGTDHVGVGVVRALVATLHDTAEDLAVAMEDVLALEPDMLLVDYILTGRERASGGQFEQRSLLLSTFDADGRIDRYEYFDVDRAEDALARLDELSAARSGVNRRVSPNLATRAASEHAAAVANRDVETIAALLADDFVQVEAATRRTFDRAAVLETWRTAVQDERLSFAVEPLATLGEHVALVRLDLSIGDDGRSEQQTSRFRDWGPATFDQYVVVGVDRNGLISTSDNYPLEQLADAAAHLYERYATTVPEGADRARAERTARTIRSQLGTVDMDEMRAALAPDAAFVDHRTVGHTELRGDEWMHDFEATWQIAAGFETHTSDVHALEPDAAVMSGVLAGEGRFESGRFEIPLTVLYCFDARGLIDRMEWFDTDAVDEALARFDRLTSPPAPRRRVVENAASRLEPRLTHALASGDAGGVLALLADDYRQIYHHTGNQLGRDEVAQTAHMLSGAGVVTNEVETLVTLGPSLALVSTSTRLAAGGQETAGVTEYEHVIVCEADRTGDRLASQEVFEREQLGAALTRLYERYAETLPEGAARDRAAGAATAIASQSGPLDVVANAENLESDATFVDRRTLGLGELTGTTDLVGAIGILAEATERLEGRIEDVLAAEPAGAVIRWTMSGIEKSSGGPFAIQALVLGIFGTADRVSRLEWFDQDDVEAALGRFDELLSEQAPPARARPVPTNAAVRLVERFDAALARGELEELDRLLTDEYFEVHHESRRTFDRAGCMSTWQATAGAFSETARTPLATLGDRLFIRRMHILVDAVRQSDLSDWGPSEIEYVLISLTDPTGDRFESTEHFTPDKLGPAIIRLYEMHAEATPTWSDRRRADGVSSSVEALLSFSAPDAHLSARARFVDHRTLGFGHLHGRAAVAAAYRSGEALARRTAHVDDVLALESNGLVVRWTVSGTSVDTEGDYGNQYLLLATFDSDGLIDDVEFFDDGDDCGALARFDELLADRARSPFENTATRFMDGFWDAVAAGEVDRIAASVAAELEWDDRRPLTRARVDRSAFLDYAQMLIDAQPVSSVTVNLVATRGERLALYRERHTVARPGEGASHVDTLSLVEVDPAGHAIAIVELDPDDLAAAVDELDARFAAGEAAPYADFVFYRTTFMRAVAAGDAAEASRMLPADFTSTGNRRTHRLSPVDRDQFAEILSFVHEPGAAVDTFAPHVRLSDRAGIAAGGMQGDVDEVEFATPLVFVFTHDGRVMRSLELYDPEDVDLAFARFEELSVDAALERFGRAGGSAERSS
jgi:class 3 adenylate cyclase/ketosteroid isomerase-like protein